MNTHSSTRHGLSLVEVLIAIGVMAIGILGTAALLPIGGAEIAEATRLERAASIGRAAYRDSVVRGTLRKDSLICPGGWQDCATGNPIGNATDQGNSVCIDPLFWAANGVVNEMPPYAVNKRLAQFPANVDNDSDVTFASKIPRMTRGTLRSLSPIGWMTAPEADSICRWRDDLIFQPFDEDDFVARQLLPGRPRQFFRSDAAALSGASREYTGDYSWMVTLTPADSEDHDPTAGDGRQLFTASFVVFHKRDLQAPARSENNRAKPPSEKVVMGLFNTNQQKTLGGGTLSLRVPDNQNTTDPEQADLPKLRANQWILLAGWTQAPVSPQSAGFASGPTYPRPVFKWYRVGAVNPRAYLPSTAQGGWAPAGWGQNISVAGPDWDFRSVQAHNNQPAVYAIILDGVVGVYEKTIKL